jgi:hypothetical protein
MANLPAVQLPVEAVQIMIFARAIGDANPAYVDIARAHELVAPPTFTETLQHFLPDYEFRPHPGRPWIGSGAAPTGIALPPAGKTTLHAEQHFEYYALIHPGDSLAATTHPGRTWQKAGRSGTMHFFECITEFHNQNGELAVVSRLVGVTIEPSSRPGQANA